MEIIWAGKMRIASTSTVFDAVLLDELRHAYLYACTTAVQVCMPYVQAHIRLQDALHHSHLSANMIVA